ncbi:restriction endonuclease subunit S [Pseudomonas sp. GL-RE-19]|uniref:restriction endonuclease subunit S n=1 Tax=Pseudomonas sp. GL-RE-19 TaxID=2832389 RepID=UPI001CBF9851|nr:restriction endonuclease subunit S [Pseudomonas sp. GL-RE-19]
MSELPIGWTEANLLDICQPKQWKVISTSELTDSGYVVYGANGKIGFYSTYTHEKPTLMITCRGATCGNLHISEPRAYINGNAMALDDLAEEVTSISYLKYVLQARGLADVITGSAQPQITRQNLSDATIKLAPLVEQTRIAQKLDELLAQVDTLKARIDAIPALLKRFRQSVIAAAASGRLTEEWRQDKSANWIATILADVIEGKPRNGYSPKTVAHETNTRTLSLSATTAGVFRGESFKYIDEEIPPESYLWLKPGDILIQRANTLEYVGVSAIYDGEPNKYVYPDLMMKCRAKDNALTNFLHICLSSHETRKYFRDNATGTAGNMPKINQQTVMSAPVHLPSLQEQTEIVRQVEQLFAFADQLEAKVAAAKTRIDHLTQSILAKAFRGELVPQDPNDEPASVLLERIKTQRAAAPKAKRTRKASV